MSAVLGMPAVQIMTACQLFVASPPAVMPAPHFGEEGYIFLQNTRRVNQQYNDLRYCGEFSNIDADAVAYAWTAPELHWATSTGPAWPAQVEQPEHNIAIGDRTPQAAERVTQSDLIPITEYCAQRLACVAAVAFEARLVSSLVDFEDRERAFARTQPTNALAAFLRALFFGQ